MEGFLYPEVDQSSCIHCNACDRVCPILNVKERKPFEQSAYIVQNKDVEVLRESTAGGAFTAIAKYVIHNSGVVFGVELNKNLEAHHIYVEDVTELKRFRNSKYVQSSVGGTLRKVKFFLEQGKTVLVIVYVEGLKLIQNNRYLNRWMDIFIHLMNRYDAYYCIVFINRLCAM